MKLAVISDIHADLISLQKALLEIEKQKCDKIVCLGDIVGYGQHFEKSLIGRDADACITMVKSNCDYVVCGNHDLHAIKKLPSYHVELGMPANWYELELKERERISGSHLWLYEDEMEDPLSDLSHDFIRKLPEYLVIEADKFNILATHFIMPDITGTSQASPADLEDFGGHLKLLKKKNCLVGLAGHAHLEGSARISSMDFQMNYNRKSNLLHKHHLIVGPAITRNPGSRGFMILDTINYEFEAISLK